METSSLNVLRHELDADRPRHARALHVGGGARASDRTRDPGPVSVVLGALAAPPELACRHLYRLARGPARSQRRGRDHHRGLLRGRTVHAGLRGAAPQSDPRIVRAIAVAPVTGEPRRCGTPICGAMPSWRSDDGISRGSRSTRASSDGTNGRLPWDSPRHIAVLPGDSGTRHTGELSQSRAGARREVAATADAVRRRPGDRVPADLGRRSRPLRLLRRSRATASVLRARSLARGAGRRAAALHHAGARQSSPTTTPSDACCTTPASSDAPSTTATSSASCSTRCRRRRSASWKPACAAPARFRAPTAARRTAAFLDTLNQPEIERKVSQLFRRNQSHLVRSGLDRLFDAPWERAWTFDEAAEEVA